MKKVLFITYYFPPSGGPGVQRILRFLNALHDFDWQPLILTVKDGDYPVRDESLLAKVPAGIEVRRTTIPEPYRLYRRFTKRNLDEAVDLSALSVDDSGSKSVKDRLALFLRDWFFIPDPRAGWLPFAIREGLRMLRENEIDLIFSSGPPNTVHLVGYWLKRLSGKPWVADFRDPWFKYLAPKRSAWLPRKIDEMLCRKVVDAADHLIWVCAGVGREMELAAPGRSAGKATVITNGFNRADFDGLVAEKNPYFTVTYVGTFFSRYDLTAFIAAVETLTASHQDFARDFRLAFCGSVEASAAARLRATTFAGNIEFLGYLPHRTTLTKMVSSSVLLLYIMDSFEGRNIPTSKLFEYLGAGRPLLALAPEDSDAGRILRQTCAGLIVPSAEKAKIRTMLLELYESWKIDGVVNTLAKQSAVEAFEVHNLTEKLVAIWGVATAGSIESPDG